jgi:hypothetical protein
LRTPGVGIDGAGLSVQAVCDRIETGPVEFAVDLASGTGAFTELATLTFDRELCHVDPGCDLPFDPTVRSGTEVTLVPEWLTRVRRAAYRNSREGRGAAS